ncbi:MAG TPA: 4Fe-4S binding protein [Candidatus Methanomethylophilaceae archaeon]|nr:4Fe-4S binding protein [Candidatus Methanomethylophilaceae archaeon]
MTVIVNFDKCLHCGGCVGSCPQNAIYMNDYIIEFNDNCNSCKRCIIICPVAALRME